MNSTLTLNQAEANRSILHQAKLTKAKMLPFPLPQTLPDIALGINIPAFQASFSLPIIDFVQAVNSGKVTIKCTIDNQVLLTINLLGKLLRGNDRFEITEVLLSIELIEQCARADFVSSTLLAMLGLGEKISLENS